MDTVSVADPGYLSRTLIFTHSGSRISDPGSKNIPFFGATNCIKLKLFLTVEEKNLGQFSKSYRTIPKKLSLSSQKYGFGIQGSKKHRIPDPEPQHWIPYI
jgi:hypothetical protein